MKISAPTGSPAQLPSWIASLSVTPESANPPTRCPEQSLVAARSVLGQQPTAWALHLGNQLSRRAVAQFPELSGDEELEALLGATQSVGLAMLRSLAADDLTAVDELDLGPFAMDNIQRRVELQDLERILRKSHAWWSEAFMTACARGAGSPSQQAQELNRVSQLMLLFMDKLTEQLQDAYQQALALWTQSPTARRVRLVEDVLSSPSSANRDTSVTLGYELHQRHHVAVVAWISEPRLAKTSDLSAAALLCLSRYELDNKLLLSGGDNWVRAWGNSARPLSSELRGLDLPPGVRCAVGRPGFDPGGFATSHHQALATRRILDRAPGIRESVVHHDDVSVLGLLLHDPASARTFTRSELGELASRSPQMASLRASALSYLERRSFQEVANESFVSRSSVAYRIRRVEQILGRPLLARPFETSVALKIAEALDGDGLLDPTDGDDGA